MGFIKLTADNEHHAGVEGGIKFRSEQSMPHCGNVEIASDVIKAAVAALTFRSVLR